jgi:hypothetical protein
MTITMITQAIRDLKFGFIGKNQPTHQPSENIVIEGD